MIFELFAATSTQVSTTSTAGWTSMTGSPLTDAATINPGTAFGLSAFFACIQAISQDFAKLPIKVIQTRRDGGKDILRDHPIAALLSDSPNGEMAPNTFKMVAQSHVLGWGNGFAEVTRDLTGAPQRLDLIHPDRVSASRQGGQVFYTVKTHDGEIIKNGADIIHVRGMGGDLLGWSIVQLGANSLAAAVSKQDYTRSYFSNHTQTGLVAHTDQRLNDTAKERLVEQMEKRLRGPEKSFRFLVMDAGLKLTPTMISADDAQLLESMIYSVQDVARWFRIPLHKIGELTHATFSNIEHQALEYVSDTLMPWCVAWEEELGRKLLTPAERAAGIEVKCNLDALLRADSKSRAEFHRTLFNLGARTPNEIRRYEGENPNPDEASDQYYIGANMLPLSTVAEANDNAEASQAAPINEDPRTANADRLWVVLIEACDRVTRKQTKAEESAQKKPASYVAWHDHFYCEHFRIYMLQNLASIATAIDPDVGEQVAVDFINEYCHAGAVITAKDMADELKGRLTQ
tara:strand:+ start:2916 stop:4466 length:1551 start_codon:yes stop_codon:yes gene_type:complete